jgi:hypothetical protein
MSLIGLVWLLVWILVVAAVVYLLIWLIDVVFAALTPAGQQPPAKLIQVLKIIVIVVAVLIVITWLIGALPPPPGLHFGPPAIDAD